jgi:hypothetical protein
MIWFFIGPCSHGYCLGAPSGKKAPVLPAKVAGSARHSKKFCTLLIFSGFVCSSFVLESRTARSAGCPFPGSPCASSSCSSCSHSVFSVSAFQCFFGHVLSAHPSVQLWPCSPLMRMSVPIAAMLHCRGFSVLMGSVAGRLCLSSPCVSLQLHILPHANCLLLLQACSCMHLALA